MMLSLVSWRRAPVPFFLSGFAALRHCRWREYNALRHRCQGFFAAKRQKIFISLILSILN
jgi:hypothetical protein